MPKIKAVFTDIDGTLLDGFVTLDFVGYLFNKGLFSKKAFAKQKVLMQKYKSNNIDYFKWLNDWAILWGEGLQNQDVETIRAVAKEFFKDFLPKIYPSSKELISLFKSNGYFVIGVSSGAIEVIKLVGEYLYLDAVSASELEVKSNKYGSRVITNLHKLDGKSNFVRTFANSNLIDLSCSIGLGDSTQDLEIFSLVGKKVALNAKPDLLKIAKKGNFLIADKDDVCSKIIGFL